MKREKALDRALGLFRKPSAELEASVQERVAQRLGLEAGGDEQEIRRTTPTFTVRRWQWSALATIAAAIAVAVLVPTRMLQSAPAVFEDANGKRQIQYGELVRASGDMSAMLSMTAGPRVEMRAASELTLERADDGGTRIVLSKGGVIVDAAAQPAESLYVQTKEMTASVSGSVSLVRAEERGSRVASIGGEVFVQQGSTQRRVRSGEQVTTSASMEPRSMAEELAWSRRAEAHMAALPQTATVIASPKERLAFETESIRPSAAAALPAPGARGGGGGANSRPTKEGCSFGSLGWTVQLDPRRLAVTRTTVFHLIAWAYPVEGIPVKNAVAACGLAGGIGLVSGGPEWIKTDLWDIQAGIPEGIFTKAFTGGSDRATRPESVDPKLIQMLQTLLAERFKLSVHRETREMPVYVLSQAPGGAKFNGRRPPVPGRRLMINDADGNVVEATPEQQTAYVAGLQGILRIGGQFDGMKLTMSELVQEISRTQNRPVIDRTGVTGVFDFHLDMQLPGQEATPRAQRVSVSLGTALERIGLKLEESKAPIDVWVIDRVEKPSEN